MARIEYEAECLCGGRLKCLFKKPTRMEASTARSFCSKCESEFMFSLSINPDKQGRVYRTEHVVLNEKPLLKEKVKEKKAEARA
jgi:hypothetical protein